MLLVALTGAKNSPPDDQISKELVELQLQGYALDDDICIKNTPFKWIKAHFEGTEEKPKAAELVLLPTDRVTVRKTTKDKDGYRITPVLIERGGKPLFEDSFVWTRYSSPKVIADLGVARVIKPFSKVVVWERCVPHE